MTLPTKENPRASWCRGLFWIVAGSGGDLLLVTRLDAENLDLRPLLHVEHGVGKNLNVVPGVRLDLVRITSASR